MSVDNQLRMEEVSREDRDEVPEELREVEVLLRSVSGGRMARLRKRALDAVAQEMVTGALDSLVEDLTACSGLFEITDTLFEYGQRLGIARIRVYLYDFRSRKLFGIDAAGHNCEATTLLRLGASAKSKDQAPKEKSDTFWCLYASRPVVVRVIPSAVPPYRAVERDDGLLEIRITEQCPNLAAHRGSVYVDVPFPGWQGKISCDFAGSDVPPDVGRWVRTFQRFVNVAAPHLVAAYNREVESHLAEARLALEGADSVDDLAERCVRLATTTFGFQEADFYASQKDALDSRLLVLRKSNRPGCAKSPFLRAVRFDEQELEAWVADKRKAAAIERCSQGNAICAGEGLGLPVPLIERAMADRRIVGVWALPLLHPTGRLGGVLTLRRQESTREATVVRLYDQVVLHRFVTEIVPPVLADVNRKARLSALAKYWEQTKEVSFQDFGAFSELLGEMGKTLRSIFVCPGAQHLFLLNVLADGDQFHHFRLGGRLPSTSSTMDRFPLPGSLTKKICEQHFVYLNELDKAHRAGWVLRIAKSAVCAMGARVAYGRNESGNRLDFGALVVMSDKHDLDPQAHGPVLKFLADRLAENLARRHVHRYLLQGLEYEARSIERKMEYHVKAIRKAAAQNDLCIDSSLQALETLLPVSRRAIQAASAVTMPPGMAPLERCNVHDVVEQVGAMLGRSTGFKNQVPRELEVMASKSVLTNILLKLFLHLREPQLRVPVVKGSFRSRGPESELVLVVDGIEQIPATSSWDLLGILEDSKVRETEKSRAVSYRMTSSLARASGLRGSVDFRPSVEGTAKCQITLSAQMPA